MKTFHLPFTWRTFASFALLLYVCGAAHEMAHHFTGALMCHHFGRMTFNLFVTSEQCHETVLPQAAGPLLSYALGWSGALMLLTARKQLLGFGLVASTLPYMRMLSAWTGGGDESVIARQLLGPGDHRWIVGMIFTTIAFPPLVIAYRSLANQRRPWVYFCSVVIPFIPAVLLQRIDQAFFIDWIHRPESFSQPTALGIPGTVIATHALAFLLFVAAAARYLWSPAELRALCSE